jgi:hypothetical protein
LPGALVKDIHQERVGNQALERIEDSKRSYSSFIRVEGPHTPYLRTGTRTPHS